MVIIKIPIYNSHRKKITRPNVIKLGNNIKEIIKIYFSKNLNNSQYAVGNID